MMRWITGASLRSRGIVLAAAVAVLVVGVLQLRELPRDSLPNLVTLFGKAANASVKHLRIVPPTYPEYLTASELTKIRAAVAALLGLPAPPTPSPSPSTAPSPSGGATPGPASPGPTPAPTQTPVPPPSDTPPPTETPAPPTETSAPT